MSSAGDLVQLSLPGTKLLFLNSLKAMTNLLRREIYCDRPHFTMAGDIMGVKYGTVLAPYGPYWRTHRKILVQTFGGGDKVLSKEFARVAEEESRALVRRLLRNEDVDVLGEVHL